MNEVQEALLNTVLDCEGKLTLIREIVSDHFGTHPDRVTWANIGSAKHVSEMLDEIMEFLGCSEQ